MRLKARRRTAKRADSIWRRMSRRRTAIGIGTALVIASLVGGGIAWQPDRVNQEAERAVAAALAWTGHMGFSVDEIFVEGRRRVSAQELRAAIGVTRGTPIFDVKLDEVRARVEALGWVKHASIARRLPDALLVAVVEREPLALWQHDDRFAVIGRDGEVITRQQIAAFSHLPQVVGADAARHAAELLRMVDAAPRIAERFDAAVRVSGRRWNLRLANGVVIKLPAHDAAQALARAERAQAKNKLFDHGVTAVDLRVPDRMFVRLGDAEEFLARNRR